MAPIALVYRPHFKARNGVVYRAGDVVTLPSGEQVTLPGGSLHGTEKRLPMLASEVMIHRFDPDALRSHVRWVDLNRVN